MFLHGRIQAQPPDVCIGEDEGQIALLVDGVVQSIVVPDGPLGAGYWPAMLPEVRPRRALILGLGGGTIAHLIWRQFGPIPVVGVENNPEVVRLARTAFGLDRPELEIVEADAFDFVDGAEGPFDYVAVDLFNAGQIPPRIFSRPFLRGIRRLMSPGGLAAVNFFKDRRAATHQHRIESGFPRVTFVESGKNLIARCRAR